MEPLRQPQPQPVKNIMSFEDAFTQYYRLKQRYESSVEKIKETVHKKYENLSVNQKRRKVEKGLKCINCKKNGGTIFSMKDNILLAVCGNSETPCTLDIELKRGIYRNIREREEKYAKAIERIRDEIIKIKLNLLFGYANEEKTITEFTKYRDLLNERAKKYRIIQKKFLGIVDDKNMESIIEEKENQLLSLVDTLKEMNKDYLLKLATLNEEQKNKHIDDLMDHYLYKIVPLKDEIVNIKYKLNDVYLDESSGKYILARESYGIKELEFIEGDENEGLENKGLVVKFSK